MKSRVTLIVTLVSLIALALLLTYNCSRLADSANNEIEHDLYVACQLTGDFSRTDSMQTRAETLKTLKAAEGSARALFESDGSVVYTSDERYSSLTDDDMAALHTIKKLTHFNWKAFFALTVLRTDDMKQLLKQRQGAIEHNGSTLSWDRVANQATMSLERNDGRRLERELSSPHLFNMLLNAGWFEMEVARHLSRWKHSHEVRLNVMFPYVEGNAKNEIDVIVNTGNRLMFVECKTHIHTLTDLDKFSKAVRNYGGTGCHALFVTFGPMTSEASEKCRDNGIIPFSFKDALTASRETEQQDVITRALHKLLDERLFTINKK
jgi:hypothetical protein